MRTTSVTFKFQTYHTGKPGNDSINHINNIMTTRQIRGEREKALFRNCLIEFTLAHFDNEQMALNACAAKLCPDMTGGAQDCLLTKYQTLEDALLEYAKQEYPDESNWLTGHIRSKTEKDLEKKLRHGPGFSSTESLKEFVSPAPKRKQSGNATETPDEDFTAGISTIQTHSAGNRFNVSQFQFPDELMDDTTIIYTNGERTDQKGKKVNDPTALDLECYKHYSIIDRKTG